MPQNCGTANEKLTTLALVAVLENDKSAVEELCGYIPRLIQAPVGTGSCEWLYGLSGLLYLLRFCRSSFPHSAQIQSAIEEITGYILRHPQPWMWHGKEYLGAVHGTIGIVTQIVLSSPSVEVLETVSPILMSLLTTQLPSGNFPSSTQSSRNDILVQFCHGAPGFLISLRSLLPHFPHLRQDIMSAIANAERCVLERGVLRKSPSLCHGLYGNALSLGRSDMLKMLRLSCPNAHEWFEDDDDDDDDEKFGLQTGEAGRCWAMAIAASGRDGSILGYNDI